MDPPRALYGYYLLFTYINATAIRLLILDLDPVAKEMRAPELFMSVARGLCFPMHYFKNLGQFRAIDTLSPLWTTIFNVFEQA